MISFSWCGCTRLDKTRMKTSISSEALNQFGAEKIAFPPKPDRRTDISKYRVALLLIIRFIVELSRGKH